jgi:hypothetical protein
MGFALHERERVQAIAGCVTDCCRNLLGTCQSLFATAVIEALRAWISTHDDWRGCVNVYRSLDSRWLYVYKTRCCFLEGMDF